MVRGILNYSSYTIRALGKALHTDSQPGKEAADRLNCVLLWSASMSIYIHIYIYVCIYIYIWRERDFSKLLIIVYLSAKFKHENYNGTGQNSAPTGLL